ncbi:uncharacterized protein Aud_003655 [Aspergillus udagawae]|uniref:Uncharacterized protein n=1 Tax=Aspergillus udagawae TaxID=91492 RepID=A0A8E0QQV1_9EURO|nr:uncharacterized protein Aud_003655 [Aspergillus udagawae]GIC87271.1 hypothetical protein Aud_003655 [Aspergillus udagawae]
MDIGTVDVPELFALGSITRISHPFSAVPSSRTSTAVTGDVPFPFDFSEADDERIKRDSDDATVGIELVAEVKERMGDLWPDEGFIDHERYDACNAALNEVKGQLLEQLAGTDEERAEYERYWPFE